MRINSFYILLTFVWFSCGKPTDNLKLKVFRYNQTEGVTSLDPAFASTQANIRVVTQLFNGLVELDESFKIQPSLAVKWEISEDQLCYTFYLHDSIYLDRKS